MTRPHDDDNRVIKFIQENQSPLPPPPTNEWEQIQRKIQQYGKRAGGKNYFWGLSFALASLAILLVITSLPSRLPPTRNGELESYLLESFHPVYGALDDEGTEDLWL